ncbi:programmed cell death protein 2-like [Convolutriloba macropyga]|uniref:programmed cell death protein 2-like n=1 Tax=Convolutriloba macropyga TaxID=536237 RepID=UPI003F52328B
MTSSWLGFKDVEVGEDEEEPPLTSEDSFIGGVPILPADVQFREADFTCDVNGCNSKLSCVAQIYCPLDSHPQMHRSLLVLVCSKSNCHQSSEGWKLFRLQWEAKGQSSVEAAPTNNEFFEQQVAWGDQTEGNGDDTWESATPSKKAHVETTDGSVSAVVDTPKVAFKQLLEPYFVEFEAEDLSKIDDKNVDVDDEESDIEETATHKPNENISLKDMPEHCQKAAKDTFTKFYHRISAEPEQIIRYGGSGEYLPVHSEDLQLPKSCSKCRRALICELQLLPSFHSCFRDSPLVHCSLGVFTCANTSTCSDFDLNCLRISNLIVEVEKD